MARLQIYSVTESMDTVIDEVCQEKLDSDFLLTGLNCTPTLAKEELWDVKKKYGKTKGVMCWYGKIIFETNNHPITDYHKISLEFAYSAWSKYYQVLVRTEKNNSKVLTRLLINSVSFSDGYKLVNNEKNWYYLQPRLNVICRKYIHSSEHQSQESNSASQNLYSLSSPPRIEVKYLKLREEMDRALNTSETLQELTAQLNADGYECNIAPRLKYWTITPKGMRRSIRIDRLGDEYSKCSIEVHLAKNRIEREKQLDS